MKKRRSSEKSNERRERLISKAEEPIQRMIDQFSDFLKALGLNNVDDSKANRIKDALAFLENVAGVFLLFLKRRAKDDWRNDGLDARAVFVELATSVRNLKSRLWDGYEPGNAVIEMLQNITLDSLIGMRRVEIEGKNVEEVDEQEDEDEGYVVTVGER